jgi:hypothetical protein
MEIGNDYLGLYGRPSDTDVLFGVLCYVRSCRRCSRAAPILTEIEEPMSEQISNKLRDMASKPYKESDRHYLRKGAEEIERLQRIIDTRPAINAGLPETYIKWSQTLYVLDFVQAKGAQS